MKSLLKIAFLTLLSFTTCDIFAQCKGFTKRNCLPELAPYMSNGQMNAAHFVPGENAQLDLNLNKGLSYRLLICADEYLSGLNYKLTDKSSGQVYHKDTLSDVFSISDLKVKQSGLINLEIKVPDQENPTGIVRSGCVTILVGFKE